MDISSSMLFPPILLYAETHFRFFRFQPSFLFRNEPEILFDMPARIAPGKPIPVMVMVNDIDKYPVDIKKVTISISQNSSTYIALETTNPLACQVTHPLMHQSIVCLFYLDRANLSSGKIFVNCKLTITCRGKTKDILNDNFPTTSRAPLTSFIAESHLPGSAWCTYGDMHTHSQFSQSHVEFGPPVSIIDTMASTYGIKFVVITDHSYDLCCALDNYLRSDPQKLRWQEFVKSTDISNSYATCIIPGEEISVRNSNGKTVHLCAAPLSEYVPGSSDGGRHIGGKNNDLTIQEAIARIEAQQGCAYAAHPGAKAGFIQSLFLHRGKWQLRDLDKKLVGFQGLNSGFSNSWFRSRKLWIHALLQGYRLALLAGSDAHGDFCRYRSIAFPFIEIREQFNRYLSHSKTGIYRKTTDRNIILNCVKNGETFVTDGPFLTISRSSSAADTCISTTPLQETPESLFVIAESTPEFGALFAIRVFGGKIGMKNEVVLLIEKVANNLFSMAKSFSSHKLFHLNYIRAELVCRTNDGILFQAATSPCYFND